jgi:tetratricopeptide (TPR) repeat protein
MSVVAVAALLVQAAVLAPAARAQAPGSTAPSVLPKAADTTCSQAASQTWPATDTLRRGEVQRLERLLPACIDNPMFLATLGGLLLEQGDAEQALIWLERSLLIDPGNLGAQADHALTLAALGEPKALEQLTRAWQARTDLPPLLRDRLFPKLQAGPDPGEAGAQRHARVGPAAGDLDPHRLRKQPGSITAIDRTDAHGTRRQRRAAGRQPAQARSRAQHDGRLAWCLQSGTGDRLAHRTECVGAQHALGPVH